MKNIILLSLTAILMASCNNSTSNNKETESLELTEILSNVDSLLDKEVVLKGWVSHTCKYSGRRCFIKSDDGKVSIKVEATGKIDGFNKELTGKQLVIVGILKVNKLSQQYIDDWQAKVEAKTTTAELEEGGKSCSAELNNITEMRDWMKENKKDYYPIYYINGTEYDIISQ